jgi:hypothetical protein
MQKKSYGHCNFTTEEILGAFALMVHQVAPSHTQLSNPLGQQEGT